MRYQIFRWTMLGVIPIVWILLMVIQAIVASIILTVIGLGAAGYFLSRRLNPLTQGV